MTSRETTVDMRQPDAHLRQMPEDAVHASPMTRALMLWLKTYGIAIAMALFLTAIAASGTEVFALPLRFLYWAGLLIGGTVIAQGVSLLMDRLVIFSDRPHVQILIHMVLIIAPITVMVWVVNSVVTAAPLNLRHLLFLLGPVTPVCVAMTALHYMLNRTPMQSHAHPLQEIPAAPAVTFKERLPFRFRQAEIYALSAEDHYLRVHTNAGQTLILMRLYDAIRELDGIEGSQTHRSWWVAKDAICNVIKMDGRVKFKLKGDLNAPVSRSFQKALRANGWI